MKLRSFRKPEAICLLFVLVVVVLGLMAGNKTLDIQLYTTYYVFRYEYVTIVSIVTLLSSALAYKFLIVRENVFLTKLHLRLVIPGVMVIMLITALIGYLDDGYSVSIDFQSGYTFILAILASTLSIIAGTVVLVLNIIYGRLNRRNL